MSAAIPAFDASGLRRSKRQMGAFALSFGIASALPFVFLTGTLSAWLAEIGVRMATIGIFSWVTLTYSFKLLWAPLISGQFKRWIGCCQLGLVLAFVALGFVDPLHCLGTFALVALAASALSATQDSAIDAWRIMSASPRVPIEYLTTAFQIGARCATIIGGAAALSLSGYIGWPGVSALIAIVFGALMCVTLLCPSPDQEGEIAGTTERVFPMTLSRLFLLGLVLFGYLLSLMLVAHFMAQSLGTRTVDVTHFTLVAGPLILLAIAGMPIVVDWCEQNWTRWPISSALAVYDREMNIPPVVARVYSATISPFADLSRRFGMRLPILIAMVVTYTISWYSWAGFTLPLYLDTLGYSKNEVAIASRLFGSIVTMLGILLGGYALLTLNRRTALVLGALIPVCANLVYADLANGAPFLHLFADHTGLTALANALAGNPKLAVLYLAVSVKNIVVGCSSAIFVGHLASLVSRQFAVVQCAALSSLSNLGGTLTSAVAGDVLDHSGFATMTAEASIMAFVAALIVLIDAAAAPRVG